MREIPSKLQCAYCRRNHSHGGECNANSNGCLFFETDKRGCIRNSNSKVPVDIYGTIPFINEWCKDYTVGGIDTEICIRRIYGISWDKRAGLLYVHCNFDYYINEFHEEYEEPSKKPNLKIIK